MERSPQDGQREVIWRYLYRGKKIISSRAISSRVIQAPINGIRRIGTKPKTRPRPTPIPRKQPTPVPSKNNSSSTASNSSSEKLTASLLVDDFESGVSTWTSNDKNHAELSSIVSSSSRPFSSSSRTALLAFRVGHSSWASLSRPIDGQKWADIGARSLRFWINGAGEEQGINLQLRGKIGGQNAIFSLPRPIRLDIKQWRQVVIPLSDFKGPHGETLQPRLSGLYQLEFVQSGNWDSRFFSLDDIMVWGIGQQSAHPSTPEAPKPPASDGTVKISADFSKVSGAIRTGGNVTVGAPFDSRSSLPLEASPELRSALETLAPRFVRLDAGTLVDLTDSSRPSFSFARLLSTARRVKALGVEVLISLPVPAEWGLDAAGYSTFCGGAAKALSPIGARYFELDSFDANSPSATALSFYNAGYNALKSINKNFSVGGFGASAGNSTAQGALLRGARGLDFLTISVSGAVPNARTDSDILRTARDISSLKAVVGLLDKSRFKRAALYVTKASLSLMVEPGETEPNDARLAQPIAGVWWGMFLASGSHLCDQIFHADAVNPSSGLLDAAARAYPAYYSIWMWNTYFPAGSRCVVTKSSNSAVFATAANTPSAHNVFLVNTTDQEQTTQLTIRGFSVLRQARIRIFDDPQLSVRFEDLPKSPFQTIKLAPYAFAVVQFIEPPN